MGVACVENTSLVYPILKDTREPTQEKDHITVTSVKSLSVCYTVYSVISLYTQDLNPFIVVSVGRVLLIHTIYDVMSKSKTINNGLTPIATIDQASSSQFP